MSFGALHVLLTVLYGSMPLAAAVVHLEYSPQTVGQPLKGMEARSDPSGTYLWSWLIISNVMKGRELFDWKGLEAQLEKNSKRGLHTILRPIIDDWTRHSLLPQFLSKIEGATTTNFQGYVVPVYSHPEVSQALVKFVEAFGDRYDGDSRIGFLEVGLLGPWGEGWSQKANANRTAEITPETRDAVYEAYARCFKKTILLLPRPETNKWTTDFGFHNEAYAFWKMTDRFHQILQEAHSDVPNRWRHSPINARVHPEYASVEKNRNLSFDHITEDRMLSWIEREHYSCIRLPSSDAMPRDVRERFVRTAQRAGYDFWVKRFEYEQIGGAIKIQVTVTNTGVAPFYYPWPVELAVLENDRATNVRRTAWDIRRVIPGNGDIVYEGTIDAKDVPIHGGTPLLRIPNLLPKGPPIRFANKEQDQDVDGWLSLGNITVKK